MLVNSSFQKITFFTEIEKEKNFLKALEKIEYFLAGLKPIFLCFSKNYPSIIRLLAFILKF